MVLSNFWIQSLGHFDDFCESGTLFWYIAINLFSLCSINNCYCASYHLRWKGERATNSNEEGKNCCNCHSYLLYLHCTGFSPMQNSQENQQQHNMQILGCVMLVELRVPSFSSIIFSIYYFLIYIKYRMRYIGCVVIGHRLHN